MPLFFCKYCEREIEGTAIPVRGRGKRARLFFDANGGIHRFGNHPTVKASIPTVVIEEPEPELEVQSLDEFMALTFGDSAVVDAESQEEKEEVVVEGFES